MSYAATAAKVAARKKLHPSEYCRVSRCLWFTGGSPCQRHPVRLTSDALLEALEQSRANVASVEGMLLAIRGEAPR